MNRTVAEVIIKALASWGVKNIYGVSGDAVLSFMDALGKQGEIKFYSTVSEQGAAFMACGEGRVTGGPGVCLATEGPGAINLVNGVADAYRDGVPMLVITGQVETAKLDSNVKQFFDQQQLFAAVTGFTTLLTRPESTVVAFKYALEKAAGDRVPCHISIPRDIFSSPVPDCDIPALGRPLPPCVSGSIEEAVKIIRSCRRPVVIAGRAAIPFRDKVFQLAVGIGAGIIPALGARGIYPGTVDILPGGLGEAHIPPVLNRVDCILLVGASPYEHRFIPGGAKVLQIDTRPQNLAHNLRPFPLTGDMRLILDGLLAELSGVKPDPQWREEIKKCHHAHLKIIGGEADLPDKPISPRKTVAILNELLPEDAVVAIDTGAFMHWFDRGFVARKQQVIISGNWRCMGYGLPFGLGAKAARPEKKVVILTGEGGFMMTMQEITTAVRYSLPIIVVVFNNGTYLLEKARMEKEGLQPFGVDVKAPDFAVLALACGAVGIRVDEPGMLREEIGKALSQDRPVVLDIISSAEKPAYI